MKIEEESVMKKYIGLILAIMLPAMSFAEEAKPLHILEIKASDYNIRVGEKLRSFGWRILNHGTKYCDFRGMGVKHLVTADLFEQRQCPDVLIGVSNAKAKQNRADKNK